METVVLEASWLTPGMRRIVVGGDDLEGFAPEAFSDSYVKCRFGDRMRSYTVRDWDAGARRLTLDFVVHGDRGLAGPWAASAQPGDRLELKGPGGGYTPSPDADWHLLVGDEAVIPAIAASLRRVGEGVPVLVVIEVPGPAHEQPLETPGDLRLTWLHGGGLAAAVAALELPEGRGHAFVHGEATAVREIRRHLVLDRGLPVDALSATGYWKERRTDEEWRADKAEWKRLAEADLAA
jgi:NADPH-dependent ferric siderophore reductase